MNPLAIKAIAALIFAAVCFGAGWRVKAAFVAERDLAAVEAHQKVLDEFRASEGRAAAALEERLQEIKDNVRVIEREKIKLVDRPVYRNECMDADGVRLVNQARTAGQADPAKPADQVPPAK